MKKTWYLVGILFAVLSFTAQCQEMNKRLHSTLSTTRSIFYNAYQNTLDIGLDYEEMEWGSLGPELNIYKFWDKDYSAIGIGLRPAIQMFFANRRAYKIYTELKGGVVYMLPARADNNLNYTFVCGFGTEVRMMKRNLLRADLIYSHFSNGKPMDHGDNPTWDGIGFTIGWVYNINETRPWKAND